MATHNLFTETTITTLEIIRASLGDLGMIQVLMLMKIFEKDGITQHEIVEDLGLLQGTVSKNCRRFATLEVKDQDTGQVTHKGMDLIKLVPHPREFKKVCLWLTPRGKALRKQVFRNYPKLTRMTQKGN